MKIVGFVVDDRKVEEKWKFCARSPISCSLDVHLQNLYSLWQLLHNNQYYSLIKL